MTISQLHGLYAVKLGSTVLGGIRKRDLRTASEIRAEATSGDLFCRFGALYAQKPMASFSTLNIEQALGACALTGTALTSGAPLLFYCQKQTEGGGRTSGSNHRILTMNEGLLIPRRLTVEHQGDAELEYEGLITYDGTNNPIAITDSAALATHPGDAERFTLGPCTLTDDDANALTFTQGVRMEIDFGVQAETHGDSSDLYDTFARIVEIKPSITLTGKNIDWFKSTFLPLIGRGIRHSGTVISLRRRKRHSTFYAAGDSEHITITLDGLAVIEQVVDASGNNVDQTSIRIPLTFDGTTNPITFTANQTHA